MSIDSKQFGDEGEELAANLLISKGYTILERNYRFGKGEIDIICSHPNSDYIIFVEVKSRKNLEYGDPVYAITKNKMSQLRRIANAYFFDKDLREADCRFDVVTILYRSKLPPSIEHYENAF